MKRMYCDRCKNLISSEYPQTLYLIANNVRGVRVNIDLCNACYKELDAWFEKPYRDYHEQYKDYSEGDTEMTNAEKFEEIFGIRPDEEFAPFNCPYGHKNCIDNWSCSYANESDDGRFECRMESWWGRLYKGIQQ